MPYFWNTDIVCLHPPPPTPSVQLSDYTRISFYSQDREQYLVLVQDYINVLVLFDDLIYRNLDYLTFSQTFHWSTILMSPCQ